jgi:uncharacterized DUF497 family protein
MKLFEWDAEKAEQNLLKHGIAFEDAAMAIFGASVTRPSPRGSENRLQTFCELNGRLITVIWTPRINAIRIISARPAKKHEQAHYSQGIHRSTEARGH